MKVREETCPTMGIALLEPCSRSFRVGRDAKMMCTQPLGFPRALTLSRATRMSRVYKAIYIHLLSETKPLIPEPRLPFPLPYPIPLPQINLIHDTNTSPYLVDNWLYPNNRPTNRVTELFYIDDERQDDQPPRPTSGGRRGRSRVNVDVLRRRRACLWRTCDDESVKKLLKNELYVQHRKTTLWSI